MHITLLTMYGQGLTRARSCVSKGAQNSGLRTSSVDLLITRSRRIFAAVGGEPVQIQRDSFALNALLNKGRKRKNATIDDVLAPTLSQ